MMKIAFSSLCGKYIDDIIAIAEKNQYKSIEWDMNFIPPSLSESRITSFKREMDLKGLDIYYHLPYSFFEIGHPLENIRISSLNTLQRYLQFISRLGGSIAVVHVGYVDGCVFEDTYSNLKILAKYADSLNISLCIENLIKGLTTNFDYLTAFLSINNVFLCLDTGHAHVVGKTNPIFLQQVNSLLGKIKHSHVYYSEDSNFKHIPFSQIDLQHSELIRILSSVKHMTFTMELDSLDTQIIQSTLLKQYLGI